MNRLIARPAVILFSLMLITSCASFNQKAIKQSTDTRRLGEAYMAKGDFSEALQYLLQAQQIYDKDYLLHDDLGKVYVAKKKYELAITHFKRSIELQPDYAPGINNLGSAYLLAGQWDNAITVFKGLTGNLVYATPQYPLYNLGWAYYNKGDCKTAIDYYEQALKVQYGFVLALRGIGLCHVKQGRMDLALNYFQKATEKSPRFPELYLDLGDAFTACGKIVQAIDAYEEVSRIQPDSEISDAARQRASVLKKKRIKK